MIFTQSGWRYGRQALRGNADVVIEKGSGVYNRLWNIGRILMCWRRLVSSMRWFSGLLNDMGPVNGGGRKPKRAARRAALFVPLVLMLGPCRLHNLGHRLEICWLH